MNAPPLNINSSGLDVHAMVKAITQAEVAPKQAQIERREKAAEVELTGLGKLLSIATPLQQRAALLSSGQAWQTWQGESVDNSRVKVSVTGKPQTGGAHEIVVHELAAREKHLAGPFSPVFRLGEGALEISVAGGTFKVDIKADMSLQAIAAAINTVARQYGARMDVLKDVNGEQLLLSAEAPGADKAIKVAGQGRGTALAEAFHVVELGRDARFSLDGVELVSHDNRVEDVIPGITLDLQRSDPGQTVRVSVTSDYQPVIEQVSYFVEASNALVEAARPGLHDDRAGRMEARMASDLLNQMRTVLRQTVPHGDVRSLVDLGIETQRDGTLVLDESTLVSALAQQGDDVKAVVTGPDGIMSAVSRVMAQWAGPSGVLGTRVNTLSRSLDQVAMEREQLSLYEQVIQDRTQRQFFEMDRQVARFKAVGERLDLLTSQLLNVQKGKR
ncbi:flagellar filament capping protein FliD [Kistimonas scapharcae]|uniref:Flagellar hook-associated protein 2 n=1 Tax=Kistimonas scapharcae TaxID=1036133 RepID=A0ABP8V9E8_9GAMM